ncbi:SAC7 [Candida margitis]|uniref:SAC7 n=1 Tax=Candida margitis TaxID=1775924 RepID=UPI002225E245|nr:SAC7 [Candida margitis]KAI5961044.1 SAC7 [Candida margitis]
MSHSQSPNNRGSIFGWAKSLKRSNLLSNESVNEISDSDSISKSPTKASYTSPQHSPLNIPNANAHNTQVNSDSQNSFNNSQQQQQQSHHNHGGNFFGTSPTGSSHHSDFLRPLLNHKSRSTNNVSRVRSNSLNQSESSIRQHRDSFMQTNALVDENSKYFGVPLQQALNEASAKISILTGDQSDGLQYGQIPIVVAKCGVYLKKNGLTVEGIFRVGGSSKRIKDLQVIFNTPPSFGKQLNWDGYTVHDAASILRRYLNALPEPLVPLNMYDDFREPLRNRKRIISYMQYKAENPSKSLKQASVEDVSSESQMLTEANVEKFNGNSVPDFRGRNDSNVSSHPTSSIQPPTEQSQLQPQKQHLDKSQLQPQNSTEEEEIALKNKKKSKNYKKLTRDVHAAIDDYKHLVNDLPVASKQLLFYVLDLLAMVRNHSKENLMSSRNLAAIFQPSILSHPNHDLDPEEYALSQLVVEFLIHYAYKLLPTHTSKSTPIDASEEVVPNEPPQALQSAVTSTSTTPLESATSLSKNDLSSKEPIVSAQPAPPPFNRRHSKSLSSAGNHEDLVVGYQHNVTGSIPFESDMDYEISDENDIGSDVEESYFHQSRLANSPMRINFDNERSEVKPDDSKNGASEEPVIVVTTPGSGPSPAAAKVE